MNRPYTFINVAMTADGKIDTFERKGSAISSKRDKERVDQLRAAADGILVGGRTLLDEQPKLTVKSEALREGRIQRGCRRIPLKWEWQPLQIFPQTQILLRRACAGRNIYNLPDIYKATRKITRAGR
jgi:riboflavin biosynthesis pyrimidine reductase